MRNSNKLEDFSSENPENDTQRAVLELIKYYLDVEEVFRNLNKTKFNDTDFLHILNISSMANCARVISDILNVAPDEIMFNVIDEMEMTFKQYMDNFRGQIKEKNE